MNETSHFDRAVDAATTTELLREQETLRLELLELLPTFRKYQRIYKRLDSLVGAKLSRQRDIDDELALRKQIVRRIPAGSSGKQSCKLDPFKALQATDIKKLKAFLDSI